MSTPDRGRRIAAVALPMALTVAGVLLAGTVGPGRVEPRPVAEVPALTRVTCPVLGAPATLVATGRDLAVTTLDGGTVADPSSPGAVTEPVVVTQRGGEVLAAGALLRGAAAPREGPGGECHHRAAEELAAVHQWLAVPEPDGMPAWPSIVWAVVPLGCGAYVSLAPE